MIQSRKRPKKYVRTLARLTFGSRMLGELWCEDGRLEIEHLNDKKTQELEMTHLGQA